MMQAMTVRKELFNRRTVKRHIAIPFETEIISKIFKWFSNM